MQKDYSGKLKKDKKTYQTEKRFLNKEESIKLLVEIIANKIVNQILHHDKWQTATVDAAFSKR